MAEWLGPGLQNRVRRFDPCCVLKINNMKPETKELIQVKIAKFVAGLNGRYKSDVSDQFLMSLIWNEWIRDYTLYSEKEKKEVLLDNLSYLSVLFIFENILEHACQAGGNGHHVAQEFADLFKDFKIEV